MKKTTLLLALLLLSSSALLAQKFFIGVQSGVNIGLPDAQHSAYHNYRYSAAVSQVKDELESYSNSLGSGLPIDLEFGYTGKSGLSFGLAGGYLHGLKYTIEFGNTYYSSEDKYKHHFSGKYFHISPFLGIYKRWKQVGFSLKVAPLIAFANYKIVTDAELASVNGLSGDVIYSVRKYEGPVSIGMRANFDVEYLFPKKSNKAIFFGLTYTHLSFSPTSSELVEYQVHGNDELASLTTRNRYSEYSTNQTVSYEVDGGDNWTRDENEPYKGNRFDIPFDNLAINIGFRIYFNRKSDK